MNINPETFESVRKLLEAEPDPAYAPLLKLFREDCPACLYHRGLLEEYRCHCDCKDAWRSRLPYWQVAPEGALGGSILYWLHRFYFGDVFDGGKPGPGYGEEGLFELRASLWVRLVEKDCNQECLEFIEQWLKSRVQSHA